MALPCRKSPHELDIATGELTLLAEDPGSVDGWVYAGHGVPVARTLADNGDIELSRFDAASGALHPIVTFDGADYPMGISPIEMTADGTGLWVGSCQGTNLSRVVRIDLTTGRTTEVDSHPEFDLDGVRRGMAHLPSPLIRNRRTGELLLPHSRALPGPPPRRATRTRLPSRPVTSTGISLCPMFRC